MNIRAYGVLLIAAGFAFALAALGEEGGSVLNQKQVISDGPTQATVVGTVVGRDGRDGSILKVKVEKIDGVATWTGPKDAQQKLEVGETAGFYAQWQKGADGTWHPAQRDLEVFGKLKAGDSVELGVYYQEHPRLRYVTVTAQAAVK